MIIGIIFVAIGIWVYYEIQNAPLMPDDYEDDMPWEEDPEVQEFLEQMDEPGPWSEEDDKIFTVGGLTNDKDKSFSKFQKKLDKQKEDEDDYPDFHEHDIA